MAILYSTSRNFTVRTWRDDVRHLSPCSCVLEKQCCQPKICRPTGSVCVEKIPVMTWQCSQIPSHECRGRTNLNQVMFPLFRLGKYSQYHHKYTSERVPWKHRQTLQTHYRNRSSWLRFESSITSLYYLRLYYYFSSIVYHCHHTMLLL